MGRDRRRFDRPRTEPNPRNEGLPFELTAHAVDRFREHVAALESFARASHELAAIARTAKRTEHRTGSGAEIWQATDGDPFLFVVKNAEGGRRICVSVLPSSSAGAEHE
jgi:hypothetical protein